MCWASSGTGDPEGSVPTETWIADGAAHMPYTLIYRTENNLYSETDDVIYANITRDVNGNGELPERVVAHDSDWYMPVVDCEGDCGTQYGTENGLQFVSRGGLEWAIPRIFESYARMLRDNSNETLFGEVLTTQTYIRVHWYWLSIPAGTVFIGAVFTLAVMWKSKGIKKALWKSSSLPFLFYGFRGRELVDETETVTSRGATISAMKKMADGVRARLQTDEHGNHARFARVDEGQGRPDEGGGPEMQRLRMSSSTEVNE